MLLAVAIPARAAAATEPECELACWITGVRDGRAEFQLSALLPHLLRVDFQRDGVPLPYAWPQLCMQNPCQD